MVDVGYLIESFLTGRQVPRTSGFDGDELYNWLMRRGWYVAAQVCGPVAKLIAWLQRGKIERSLIRYFESRQPRAVVSFVPFFNAAFRSALLRACPDAHLFTVVTDFKSTSTHPWIDAWDETDARRHVIVAGTEALQQQAEARGYPPGQILRTSGMVVHPSFSETPAGDGDADEPSNAAAGPYALICFGGFAPTRRTLTLVRSMRQSRPDLRLVVLCGGNENLRRQLEALYEQAPQRCVAAEGALAGEEVAQRMRKAAFVVGKPGPGLASEACACGVPFVTDSCSVMEQERSVLAHLEESGVGIVLPRLTSLPPDLEDRLRAARAAIAAQPRNAAAREVADELARAGSWHNLAASLRGVRSARKQQPVSV